MTSTTNIDRPRIADALPRLAGVVKRTELAAFDARDERVELRLKLENTQETGAFKARGAWNQIAQLSDAERAAGVVTLSSGNHGKALAWAAQRAGVRCCVVMPADAYPNKIQACRDFGAEVVLAPTREACDGMCRERVEAGATLVHPYDAERTAQGAGTVALEILEQWPQVEVVIVPCGGGGLLSGCALAIRQTVGERVCIIGVEPDGAPSMTLGIAHGEPVTLESITTKVQGLCPPYSGAFNIAVCKSTVDYVLTLSDETIFAAQKELVVRGGWTVEPAGSAGAALVLARKLPEQLLVGRTRANPLRVVAVLSGGNPDPKQIAALRA